MVFKEVKGRFRGSMEMPLIFKDASGELRCFKVKFGETNSHLGTFFLRVESGSRYCRGV